MNTSTSVKRPIPTPPPTNERTKVTFGKIQASAGHRVVLYGPGGIGKTTLAAHAPGAVAFFDLDDSLPRLQGNLGTAGVLENIVPVAGVETWQDLRSALQSDGWDGIRTICIDRVSRMTW